MIIEKIMLAIIISFTILAAHELGHYCVHRMNGRNPKINFWYVTFDIYPENKKEFQSAALAGIISGLIAITLFFETISKTALLILLLAYIICCSSDIQQIRGKKPYMEKQ